MKILHTVNRYHPEVGGSEEVVRQISERLVRRGHDVTVATSFSPKRSSAILNGVRVESFSCKGNLVEGISGERERYLNFVRNFDGDVMMNYGAQIWCTDLLFDELSSLKLKKVLVPCCYYRLSNPAYKDYFTALPKFLSAYDVAIYLSEGNDDACFARFHGLRNGVVVPNGADVLAFDEVRRGEFRRKQDIPSEQPLIITVSNHGWIKGHDFFWRCVKSLPKNQFAVALIGEAYSDNPKKWVKECYPSCRLKGWTTDVLFLEHLPRREVMEAFVDADIFLFTSRYECSPLVMFEAFASKTLFISTNAGNIAEFKNLICLVKNEENVTNLLFDYATHPKAYDGRIQQAYELIRSQLNWGDITGRYERLYKDLVG